MNRSTLGTRLGASVLVVAALVSAAPAAPAVTSASGTTTTTATTGLAPGTYLAQSGDTWAYIAPRVGVELADLLRANGATTSTAIRAGQPLVLPAVSKHLPATSRTGTPYSGPMAPSSAGRRVTVVGDSIALGAASLMNLEMPGLTIDAREGRTFAQGLTRLAELKQAGRLGDVVVLGLGVNDGGATATQVRQAMNLVGTGRTLVLVTASGPVAWETSTNTAMRNLAATYPSRVVVADWKRASAYVTDFREDRIHPRGQGASVYARLVRLAVDTAPVLRSTTPRTVTVQAGDTLSLIATRYGVTGGWQALATLNKISDPYVIRIGQTLLLPATSTTTTPATYTVLPGQGWYAVSRATGIPVAQLLSLNGATLSTEIHPGQRLRLR